ncbi:hypothetical protein O6H91_12G033900 [Diphasiastrum complanatum]|nr:hypothetical protein O6H91_12G033900 [Diphasiastrum complanatum]
MDSDFEFASSLLSCEGGSSMKNSVDHLREMGFTYFSAPTSPGRDEFCWQIHDEKLVKPEQEQEQADDGNDSDFEFASKLSEADSVTSAPMSSADELFFKGRILPLKPPPRLQCSAPTAAEVGSVSIHYRTSGAAISAPQSPKYSWKDRTYFGASCAETNPANIDLLLGMDTSLTKSTFRKEEWIKSLSPLRFFRKDHKTTTHMSSLQPLPRQKQSKPASDGGTNPSNTSNNPDSLDQRHQFQSKSSIETFTLKNLLHLNGCDTSKCSKNDLNLSADAASSKKWYDKSNNRKLENGAERSWPRSSAKSILQTRSTRASSSSKPSLSSSASNQKQNTNKKQQQQQQQQQQQRGGRGSSAISPHELHYRSYRTSTEQARRTTYLPYKKGLLGCFSFAHFKIPGLSARLETVVT